jgi:DNA-binding PadR family transcriptional regulator
MMLTMAEAPQRSALGLLVLAMLFEEPMHVYRMQRLIEQWGKHRVVNVRSRASLYQAIERLVRLGLVEVRKTVRTEGRPDRVVYGITENGREVAGEWLREMLRSTGDEYPEFIAAVSMLFGLTPDDAREQLELRARNLEAVLADTEAELAGSPGLSRLFLLEEEYRRAVTEAELAWVRGIVDDIREGRLTWDEEWLRQMAAAFSPPEEEDER